MKLEVNPIAFYVLMLVVLALGLLYLTWGYLSSEPFRMMVSILHFTAVVAMFFLIKPHKNPQGFKLQ